MGSDPGGIGVGLGTTTIRWGGGTADVPCMPTATPRLVVGRLTDPGFRRPGVSPWVVFHRRSGLAVAGFDEPEAAMRAADALAAAGDWEVPATEFGGGRYRRVQAILDEGGGLIEGRCTDDRGDVNGAGGHRGIG